MIRLARSKCAVLPLVLKKRWFDMIALGQKKEEYRDCTDYWETRILNWMEGAQLFNLPAVIEFRLGYATRARRTAFLLGEAGPTIRKINRFMHPDWGEPQCAHWVLPLGERVVLKEDAE